MGFFPCRVVNQVEKGIKKTWSLLSTFKSSETITRMNYFKIFLIFFITYVKVSTGKECPEVDEEYASYLPHESDCGLFYECSNGEPVLLSCPPGLEWNREINVRNSEK